jgi:hypothetical protein
MWVGRTQSPDEGLRAAIRRVLAIRHDVGEARQSTRLSHSDSDWHRPNSADSRPSLPHPGTGTFDPFETLKPAPAAGRVAHNIMLAQSTNSGSISDTWRAQ